MFCCKWSPSVRPCATTEGQWDDNKAVSHSAADKKLVCVLCATVQHKYTPLGLQRSGYGAAVRALCWFYTLICQHIDLEFTVSLTDPLTGFLRYIHNIPSCWRPQRQKRQRYIQACIQTCAINKGQFHKRSHTHATNTDSKRHTGSWDTDRVVKCLRVGAKYLMTLAVWARWSVSGRYVHSGKSWANIQKHWLLTDDNQPQTYLFPGCRLPQLLHCHSNSAKFPSPLVKWNGSEWFCTVCMLAKSCF